MRALLVTHLSPQHEVGSSVYVGHILRALVALGVSVNVRALVFENHLVAGRSLAKSLDIPGVEFEITKVRKSTFAWKWVEHMRGATAYMRRERPDVVFIRNHWFTPLVQTAKRRGIPTAILHDGVVEELLFRKPGFGAKLHYVLGSMAERTYYRHADWILPVTQELASYEHERYGVHPDRQLIMPTPAHDRFFSLPLRSENPDGVIRFIYIGTLDRWQEFGTGLDYLEFLKQNDFRVHLTVLTADRANAEGQLTERGWTPDNYLITRVPHDEVPAYLADSHIGIGLKSDAELVRVASPIKHAEYLAAGLPVVISDNVGTLSRLVSKHRLGVVISLHDRSTWEASLPVLAGTLQHFRETSERCRSIATQLYSGQYVRRILQGVLGRGGSSGG